MRQVFLVASLVCVLNACERKSDEVDKNVTILPALPQIATADLLPEVREQFEEIQNRLTATPNHGRKNRDYAELLHAYSLFEPAKVMYKRCKQLRPSDLDCHYLEALVGEELGHFEDAIISLKYVMKRRPAFQRASVVLANIYRDLNELDLALPLYTAAVKKQPDNLEAQFGLAQTLLSLGRVDEAVVPLNVLHAKGRNFGAVHTQFANIARQQRDLEGVRFHTAAAKRFADIKIPFQDPLLWAVQNKQKGDSRYLREASAAFKAGNYRQAVNLYEEAIKSNPQNASPHASLVGIYGKLGQLTNARLHFDKAIASDPQNTLPYVNMGTILMQRGQFEQARTHFANAVKINPQHTEALTLRTYCDALLGEQVDPEIYRQALEYDPTYSLASYLLARHVRDSRDCEEALPLFRDSLRLETASTPVFAAELADCLIELDQRDEAARIVEQALASAKSYGNQKAHEALSAIQQKLATTSAQ